MINSDKAYLGLCFVEGSTACGAFMITEGVGSMVSLHVFTQIFTYNKTPILGLLLVSQITVFSARGIDPQTTRIPRVWLL